MDVAPVSSNRRISEPPILTTTTGRTSHFSRGISSVEGATVCALMNRSTNGPRRTNRNIKGMRHGFIVGSITPPLLVSPQGGDQQSRIVGDGSIHAHCGCAADVARIIDCPGDYSLARGM